MANNDAGDRDLPLRDAVARFRLEDRSWTNSYDWWRRNAQRGGRVDFGTPRQLAAAGSTEVRARKSAGKWMVDRADFDAALTEHRAANAELAQITRDYELRRLVVGPGKQVHTTWGGYRVLKDFHVTQKSAIPPWDGYAESWVCNQCWKSAELEHNNEECHRCSDWGPCGRDCTLSTVRCADCGTSLTV